MSKRPPIWDERLANGFCQYCGKNPPDTKRCTRPDSPPSKACVECKAWRASKYKDRPYNSKERAKEYRREVRTRLLEKYGNCCACCKEDRWEFLAVDHKNGDGNIERMKRIGSNKNGAASYQFYLQLLREPLRDDIQILCHNCNNSFGHYGYSPACPGCIRNVAPHFKTVSLEPEPVL